MARYSSKFSKQRYTLHQHIVLLCLKVRKDTTYRTLLDELIERAIAHESEIRPLIKYREFSSLQKAWNARLDSDLYGQRNQSETVNSRLKRKYGTFVRSRRRWKQFRELALACIVHNLDRAL